MEIAELRKKTGLSQAKFCEKYNLPLITLKSWEAGKRTAPEYVQRLLAYAIYVEEQFGDSFSDFEYYPKKTLKRKHIDFDYMIKNEKGEEVIIRVETDQKNKKK